ncbi:MAG: alpha/beta hydrolase [Pseudomonadota bacterium]
MEIDEAFFGAAIMMVPSDDGKGIPVRYWASENPIGRAVQIVHGLGEHCGRYARLAAALNAVGYHVFSHDNRGHGETIVDNTEGYFAAEAGWERVIDDVFAVRRNINVELGRPTPTVLLGHSMGSYIAQAAMLRSAAPWHALALSGSTFGQPALLMVASWIARFERWRLGGDQPSKLLTGLSFGSFNKKFEPVRTAFDWLSRDEAEVDRYIADEWCGFDATTGLWVDLLGGLRAITNVKALSVLPPTLPIYVFGGSDDPVSATDRLPILAEAFRNAGVQNVTLKVYKEARHEVFNETNRDEVTGELIDWLGKLRGFPANKSV